MKKQLDSNRMFIHAELDKLAANENNNSAVAASLNEVSVSLSEELAGFGKRRNAAISNELH